MSLPSAAESRIRLQRGRALAALLTLVVATIVFVTDVHGRAQVREANASEASLRRLESQEGALLTATQAHTWTTKVQDWAQESSLEKVQASLVVTDAANSATQAALATANYNIAALDTCLTGAIEALDQLGVGQSAGALMSLSAVASSCKAAKPTNG